MGTEWQTRPRLPRPGRSGTRTVPFSTGTALVTRTPLPVIIALPTPVQTATLVLGANTATWTGDLAVTLPPVGVVAGLYTGTVTHSVA